MAEAVVSPAVDPRRDSTFVSCFGVKGSGKSYAASWYWQSWPFDRLCIDSTGDAEVGDDITERFSSADELPARFPSRFDDGFGSRRERTTYVFHPDAGSSTALDDVDRALALAWHHPQRKCLVWIDEIGMICSANVSPPYLKRILMAGRHQGVSALFCGPRPQSIDVHVLLQSDLVYTFKLPNPNDKRRIADSIGWDPKEFAEAVDSLDFERREYLLFDARSRELVLMPPLPAKRPRRQAPDRTGL